MAVTLVDVERKSIGTFTKVGIVAAIEIAANAIVILAAIKSGASIDADTAVAANGRAL